MVEMLDVLDENTGQRTGEIIPRSEAHRDGTWHGSIHVLLVSEDKSKTLLQKRSCDKKLYPNTWDIAVGGHISAGQTPKEAALRELEEELGINCDGLKMDYIKAVKESLNNNGIISNEFVSIFIVYKDIPIENIDLQEEEVSEAKWMNKEELNNLITSAQMLPHVEEYKILNEILS